MTDIGFSKNSSTVGSVGDLLDIRLAGHKLDGWLTVPTSVGDFIESRPAVVRLLGLAMVTDAAFFITFAVKSSALHIHPAIALDRFDFTFWFAIAFLGRTIFLGLLASALSAYGSLVGAASTTRDTFTGVVWGATMAVRVAVVSAIVAIALGFLRQHVPVLDAKWVAVLPYWLSFGAFVWYVAIGAAAAHKINPINSMVIATFLLSLAGWVGTVFLLGLRLTAG